MNKFIFFQKSIVAILIFALALPYGFLAFPKKAEAVVPVMEMPGPLLTTTIANAKTNLISATQNTAQTGLQTSILATDVLNAQYTASLHQAKVGPVPFVPFGSWDQIGTTLMKMMLGVLTSQMITWIQGGGTYPGGGSGSLFVNDILGYMTSVADSAAGKFLEQMIDPQIFNLLCTPFRLPMFNALRSGLNFPYLQRARCTLTDIANNITDFTNGGFLLGGWKAWNEISQPQNNIYGSYLMAQSELMGKKAAAIGVSQTDLSFGQGFLSQKKCIERATNGQCLQYKIITPGNIIEDQLATQLGSGVRSLEIADSLNEIIAAVVTRLITEILTGGQGVGGWQAAQSPAWQPFTETQKPDLVVSGALTYSPLNPQTGQIMSFSGNIYNTGGNATTSVGAELKIDAGNDGIWDVSFPAVISLGERGSGLASWQNVWTAISGSHRFRICADPGNSVNESNETNNCSESIFQVPDLAGLQADLVVEAVSFSPSSPVGVGNLMIFRGVVRNAGTVAIADSSTTRLRIDVGNNGSWDIDVNASTGLLLQNGREEEVWANIWTATLGTHKFEICADVNNAVDEGNENNNCASGVFEVIKKPDLIISSISFSPLYPGLGNLMTFSGAIKNQGDAASSPSQARLRIDTGNNGSWDVAVSPDQPISNLAPAGTATTSWQSAWRASLPGLNAFEICADAAGVVNESNEQNNCARQTFWVSSSY